MISAILSTVMVLSALLILWLFKHLILRPSWWLTKKATVRFYRIVADLRTWKAAYHLTILALLLHMAGEQYLQTQFYTACNGIVRINPTSNH